MGVAYYITFLFAAYHWLLCYRKKRSLILAELAFLLLFLHLFDYLYKKKREKEMYVYVKKKMKKSFPLKQTFFMRFPQIQHIPSWPNLQHKSHGYEKPIQVNHQGLSSKHLLLLYFL